MLYGSTSTDPRSQKAKLLSTLGSMRNERSSWDGQWKEIERVLLPRSGRFLSSDRNRGDKRHNNIYDGAATRALRILAAGLQSGATNPSRPWLRLATIDPLLMKNEAVKIWLNEATRIMLDVFARSNTYRAFHSMYAEMAGFGTACSVVVDSFDRVLHNHTLTIGEYSLATDHEDMVNAVAREFDMTVGQMVAGFGFDKCSRAVQQLYNNGKMNEWVPVVHIIQPRTERDRTAKDAKNMPFASNYFEPGSDNGDDKMLRESGFKHFRAVAPRWDVTSNDIYGSTCPGMEALGDIKQLQHEQVRKGENIDQETRPALQVPSKLKGRALDRLPGGVSYYDANNPGGGVRRLFEGSINLQHLLLDIQDVRERIREAFYTDLFFAISQQDKSMTALETSARQQEQLLQMGPVLERVHNEMLNQYVDIAFVRMIEARGPNGASMLPPPPPELQGVELKIEYTSMLAQAQRAIDTNAIDRYTFSIGTIAQFKPGVLDKFNEDKWAEIYADRLGVDPELIVADNQVALIRKNRQAQQDAAQQAALLNAGADTASKLANTDTSGKNALTDIVRGNA